MIREGLYEVAMSSVEILLCLKQTTYKATTAQMMHGKSLTFSWHERVFLIGKSLFRKWRNFRQKSTEPEKNK